MSLLEKTIRDPQWMRENREHLKSMLPETLTHVANVSLARIGFELKLLGVDWRSQEDLANCLAALEKAGILYREGMCFRAAP